MFCGNIGQHPLVCCPIKPGPSTKPQADTPIIESEVDCGKSLIYGPQYNGLGAFPFVARIGFKSKQLYPQLLKSIFLKISIFILTSTMHHLEDDF